MTIRGITPPASNYPPAAEQRYAKMWRWQPCRYRLPQRGCQPAEDAGGQTRRMASSAQEHTAWEPSGRQGIREGGGPGAMQTRNHARAAARRTTSKLNVIIATKNVQTVDASHTLRPSAGARHRTWCRRSSSNSPRGRHRTRRRTSRRPMPPWQ